MRPIVRTVVSYDSCLVFVDIILIEQTFGCEGYFKDHQKLKFLF